MSRLDWLMPGHICERRRVFLHYILAEMCICLYTYYTLRILTRTKLTSEGDLHYDGNSIIPMIEEDKKKQYIYIHYILFQHKQSHKHTHLHK